tara:strand:+ start:415 stop:768 length:354 start_codon:yes stop_codon:yes gene_type:complete
MRSTYGPSKGRYVADMTSYSNWEYTAARGCGRYSALGINKHEGQRGKVSWYGSHPTIEEVVAYVEKRGRKHCDLLIYDNTQSPIKLVKIIEDFNLDKTKIWADDGRYLRDEEDLWPK